MGKDLSKTTQCFYVCDGGSCRKAGSEKVTREARTFLRNNNLWDTTHTIRTRCNGRCEDAPTWIAQPGNYWYKNVTPELGVEILQSHINNNQPVASALLFQEGWEHVQSDNERSSNFIQPFALKTIDTLGSCYVSKGLSSDQYLYPLFRFIEEQKVEGTIFFGDQHFELSQLVEVRFDHEYIIELLFTGERKVELVIGPVLKTDTSHFSIDKIRSTEYFSSIENDQKGIMFKNKFGNLIAQIHFSENDQIIWEYCLRIQLNNSQLPELEENVK